MCLTLVSLHDWKFIKAMIALRLHAKLSQQKIEMLVNKILNRESREMLETLISHASFVKDIEG